APFGNPGQGAGPKCVAQMDAIGQESSLRRVRNRCRMLAAPPDGGNSAHVVRGSDLTGADGRQDLIAHQPAEPLPPRLSVGLLGAVLDVEQVVLRLSRSDARGAPRPRGRS